MARIAPAAQSILDQASRLWPNRNRASDGTLGDASHSSRTSDHNPDSRGIVHAADLTHDPAHGVDCHKLSEQIKNDPRVKYVIWNRRIWSPSVSRSWRYYSGSNPHTAHMHVSVNSGSIENSTAPWFKKEGFTVAEVQQIVDAIQRQGELTREKIEASTDKIITAVQNQGKLTREKIAAQN